MTEQDIGDLSAGPVLLFGGVYSNLQALEAILAVARDELCIPKERIIHTGDVVAYCASAKEASILLRQSGVHCLMGNCEESIGEGSSDCGCGFPADSACNAYSVNWYAYVMEELKDDSSRLREWMNGLPRRIAFSFAGRRFAVVHGSPAFISKFLWPSTDVEVLEDDWTHLPEGFDGIVSGHSGMPFVKFLRGDRMWLNAGVIGMPANDGTSRGWYAILTATPSGGIQVSIRALDFDAKKAADCIYAKPALNRGYADALTSGIWPSHDILPLEEQMNTGVPLSEQTFTWQRKTNGVLSLGSTKAIAIAASMSFVIVAAIAWQRGRRGQQR